MSFLQNAEERRHFARRLRARQRSIDQKQKNKELESKFRHDDAVWKFACDGADGNVRIAWQDLPRVSDRIYNYHNTYGRDLIYLALDGVNLSSLQEIPHRCQELRHLSLGSNVIDDITGIHLLRKLVHLNLLRNNLTTLPPGIGDLVNLSSLELANNKLSKLPSSIGRLFRLNHLNLESNMLADLPRDFGQLKCEVLNLNYNKFLNVPDCIMSMKNLHRLSVMGNELTSLPIGMQRCTLLEALLLSRNKINILPDSIVDLRNLRELWLDHNQLSSLPSKFHRLTKLKVLKLQGNVDMIYPNLDIVAKGVEEVLRWSRARIARNRVEKVRHIIQSLGEILLQIQKYKVGGHLHESLFRVLGDHLFQFPPDAIWSVLLPELNKVWNNPDIFLGGINSFPFERHEVEQAIFTFSDAAGPIVKKISSAKFRVCSCVTTRQRTQPCNPTDDGWPCTRPALLLRMKMVYEENRIQNCRIQAREKKITEAAKTAAEIARNYLKTDDGRMMVRDEAERRFLSGHENQNTPSRSSFASTVSAIASIFRGNRESFKSQRKRIEEEVRKVYIDQEVAKSVAMVNEEYNKVQMIMKKWVGKGIQDIFQEWRHILAVSKKNRRGEVRAKLREERRLYEHSVAAYELKNLEVSSRSFLSYSPLTTIIRQRELQRLINSSHDLNTTADQV